MSDQRIRDAQLKIWLTAKELERMRLAAAKTDLEKATPWARQVLLKAAEKLLRLKEKGQ